MTARLNDQFKSNRKLAPHTWLALPAWMMLVTGDRRAHDDGLVQVKRRRVEDWQGHHDR